MRYIFILVLLFFIGSLKSYAQSPQEEDSVYLVVEEKPEFPGGEHAMIKFISENIKYPKKAVKRKVQGLVVLSFVINKKGDIENIEVLKSVSQKLDRAAIKVVKKMPRWEPGTQKGIPVKVKVALPIRFRLDD